MKKLALLAALPLVLTACSSGSGDAASSSSPSSSTSETTSDSPSESSTSSDLSGNPLGTEATVNQDGSLPYTVAVTAYEPKVAVAYDDQSFLGLKAGQHWSRAKAKVCPTKTADVSWFMFSGLTKDGATYPGIDQSFHDPFPGPLLPENIEGIPAGPCRSGWVYIPVDNGSQVSSVVFQDGAAAVSWATP